MISEHEMAEVLAYLTAGVGLRDGPTAMQCRVYRDLLGEWPVDVLKAACRQALLEHDYHTLPPVSLINRLADEIQHGPQLLPDEAFGQVQRGLRRCNPYRPESFQEASRECSDGVLAVVQALGGWRKLLDAQPDVLRGQFMKRWAEHAERADRQRRLPERLRNHIADVRRRLGGGTAPIGDAARLIAQAENQPCD